MVCCPICLETVVRLSDCITLSLSGVSAGVAGRAWRGAMLLLVTQGMVAKSMEIKLRFVSNWAFKMS